MSATARGVPPIEEMRVTISSSSTGNAPALIHYPVLTEPAAPFRTCVPPILTPLMRVCAVNGINSASRFADTVRRPRRLYFLSPDTTIERPSGVSSARLESCAAFASSSDRLTPGSGINSVCLPVSERDGSRLIEQERVHVSRRFDRFPDMASTLCCMTRSIPAIPMADKQAAYRCGDQADQQRDQNGNTSAAGSAPAERTLYTA